MLAIMKFLASLVLCALPFLFSCDKASESVVETNEQTVISNSGELNISFDFKHGGIASSQFAIWLEDEGGKLVKTIFVTSFTATRGYSFRPDALPIWVSKAKPGAMQDSEVDAVSGATPQNGSLTYSWDGTNDKGVKVESGKYNFFIEGTLYWSSRVLFSGTVDWGGANQQNIPVKSQLFSPSETNKDMITSLKASYSR